MPLVLLPGLGFAPRSCWQASIHWSRVGGTAPSVSVSGQNHSAAQASMTRRSRWYAPFALVEGLLDLLAGDRLRVARIVAAPQLDVTPGLGLGDLKSPQRQSAIVTRPGARVRPVR